MTEAAIAMRATVGLAAYLVGLALGRGVPVAGAVGAAVGAGLAGGTSLGSSCCAFANIWFASAVLPVSRRSSARL